MEKSLELKEKENKVVPNQSPLKYVLYLFYHNSKRKREGDWTIFEKSSPLSLIFMLGLTGIPNGSILSSW